MRCGETPLKVAVVDADQLWGLLPDQLDATLCLIKSKEFVDALVAGMARDNRQGCGGALREMARRRYGVSVWYCILAFTSHTVPGTSKYSGQALLCRGMGCLSGIASWPSLAIPCQDTCKESGQAICCGGMECLSGIAYWLSFTIPYRRRQKGPVKLYAASE